VAGASRFAEPGPDYFAADDAGQRPVTEPSEAGLRDLKRMDCSPDGPPVARGAQPTVITHRLGPPLSSHRRWVGRIAHC